MHGPHQPVTGITPHAKGCVISLSVAPRSPVSRVEIDATGAVRIRLTAPPVDGAANASLFKFLAAVLDVPRSNLSILAGAQARHKRLLAEGINEESARSALVRAAGLR